MWIRCINLKLHFILINSSLSIFLFFFPFSNWRTIILHLKQECLTYGCCLFFFILKWMKQYRKSPVLKSSDSDKKVHSVSLSATESLIINLYACVVDYSACSQWTFIDIVVYGQWTFINILIKPRSIDRYSGLWAFVLPS